MNIAVLISGRGSNLNAIIQAGYNPLVIADRECEGLKYADQYIIEDNENQISAILDDHNIELVVLAGFMKILSERFVIKHKVINTHPSLLPAFKGLNTHRRALEAGVIYHGCTLHRVTKDLNSGPIIDQATIVVHPEDTEESLSNRVLHEEHKLIIRHLNILTGKRMYFI